jgi:hypothetical protein
MAQITLDLSQFKASGIYTIEIDQSQQFLVNPQTVRLVVGFSKKGPFNAPVYCPDLKTARQVFGDIDPMLERKGSFFHRSLFTCLQTGPVFALNLLALNDDISSPSPDEVEYRALSIDTAEQNGTLTSRLLSSYYNKERFWKPDPSYFLATVAQSLTDAGKLFDVVNIGKTPMSVIFRKSGVKGYDVTAKEWYNDPNVPKPEWMNDDDYISDFFIDVIAFQGNWTDYDRLSTDPVFSPYFTPRGFRTALINGQDPIKKFASLTEVTLVASITGCLIPDFQDKNGVPQFIETLINNTTATTGLFCAVNKKAFDDLANNSSTVDLVGHHMVANILLPQLSFDFLSYKAPLVNDHIFNDHSYGSYDSPFDVYIAPFGSSMYTAWENHDIADGDIIFKDNVGIAHAQYLKFFKFTDSFGNPYLEVRAYDDDMFTSQENIMAPGSMYMSDLTQVTGPSDVDIISLYGQYNKFYTTVAPAPNVTLNATEFILSQADAGEVGIGELFVTATGDRLTRVIKKTKLNIAGDTKITCSAPVLFYASNQVQKFMKIVDYVKTLNFTYFEGFALTNTHLPDGSDIRMNEILDVLWNTNIANALADKNIITWRYVVDTFNGGLEPNSKYQLAQLAAKRKQAMALLNAPSAQRFIDSTDPVFTDAPTQSNPKPVLDTAYIVSGGNQDLNPSFTFTLVDEANGSKNAGYFFPNIVLTQNGRNITVPPAAHVSNNFIQKFISGNPYSIVAGTRRGIISDPNLVGPEIELFDTDRENLEPFGINPIVRQRGIGTVIYANQTGYQRVNSALNNLHVRDILITIEEGIEQILKNYVFEFNDAATRLEITSKVENYLERVQSAGGLYDFAVIMNTLNNTPDIIDQNVGIIDVVVEPTRGLHKIINRVTITRTGAIASGGFTLA